MDFLAAGAFIYIFAWVFCAAIASAIAGNKGRSSLGWFVLGLFFGPLAILCAAIMSADYRELDRRKAVKDKNKEKRDGPIDFRPLPSSLERAVQIGILGFVAIVGASVWGCTKKKVDAPITQSAVPAAIEDQSNAISNLGEQAANYAEPMNYSDNESDGYPAYNVHEAALASGATGIELAALEKAMQENEICQGDPREEVFKPACKRRTIWESKLTKMGWCHSEPGDSAATRFWRKCSSIERYPISQKHLNWISECQDKIRPSLEKMGVVLFPNPKTSAKSYSYEIKEDATEPSIIIIRFTANVGAGTARLKCTWQDNGSDNPDLIDISDA